MTEDWELDGRQMPDEVLEYLRKIAVRAVEEQGYSPEVVIGVLGLSRSCMDDWLQRYQTQGLRGLEGEPPGAGGGSPGGGSDGGLAERDGAEFDAVGAWV